MGCVNSTIGIKNNARGQQPALVEAINMLWLLLLGTAVLAVFGTHEQGKPVRNILMVLAYLALGGLMMLYLYLPL